MIIGGFRRPKLSCSPPFAVRRHDHSIAPQNRLSSQRLFPPATAEDPVSRPKRESKDRPASRSLRSSRSLCAQCAQSVLQASALGGQQGGAWALILKPSKTSCRTPRAKWALRHLRCEHPRHVLATSPAARWCGWCVTCGSLRPRRIHRIAIGEVVYDPRIQPFVADSSADFLRVSGQSCCGDGCLAFFGTQAV
jgi:hypothetical protein